MVNTIHILTAHPTIPHHYRVNLKYVVAAGESWTGITLNLHSEKRLQTLLRETAYPLAVVTLIASLIDLFVTRLLFRAGPDVLAEVDPASVFYLAIVGRIAVNLEQFLIFAFIGVMTFLLLRETQQVPRILGVLLATTAACSAVLYAPLAAEQAWAVSTLLVLVAAVIVPVLAYQHLTTQRELSQRLSLTFSGLLICLVLSFTFPLYYRLYLLFGAAGVTALPFSLEAYLAGIFSIMATALVSFAYAIQAPSPGFGLGPRNVLRVTLLPTLLVAPMLYEFLSSFFAVQIFGLVLTMSTDIAISHGLIDVLVVVFWFLLTAVLLLLFKGRHSSDRMLVQQGMGLVLLMSTTMLFNYPFYLMLGLAGAVLLCYPLMGRSKENLLVDSRGLG